MIKFINNHSMAHHIFCNHFRLELLKIAKTRFDSYYLTFRYPFEGKEALANISSKVFMVGFERQLHLHLIDMNFRMWRKLFLMIRFGHTLGMFLMVSLKFETTFEV